LDDVAVLQAIAQGHDLAVHARAHALMTDLGVDAVGEVDGRRPPGQGLDLALGREAVDLLRVEVELERVQELVRVLDLLLPFQELAHPGEGLVVLVRAAPALLVFPMGGDAFFGDAVHLARADLHLEGVALVADDGRVQRAIAVGPWHGDEVLDAPGHRPPEVVEHAQGGVAVGDGRHHDAQGDEVVDLVDVDALLAELLVDGVQALDAPLEGRLQPRRLQLLGDRRLDLLDELDGARAPLLDALHQLAIGLGLQVLEREVLELVLDLAHPQPPGQGRVDVHGLARDAHAALLGQVLQGAHVVQAVGELHDDHAHVVDHGQEQLAEVLGLALLGGGEGDLADLGDALHDVEDVRPEVLLDLVRVRQGVLEHVVQEAYGHAGGVHAQLGQDGRHLERVHQVGLPAGPRLALVLDRGEDVRLPEHLEVGPRMVPLDGLVDVFEADHGPKPQSRSGFRERQPRGLLAPMLLTRPGRGTMIFVFEAPGPVHHQPLAERRLMKTSTPVVALALIAVLGTGVGCARVRSKAAMKDGNKDYKEENFKKAVDDYERAVALDPNFSEAWFYLGSSHQAQYRPGKESPENKKQLEDAIEAFKKSLETNPGQTDGQKNVKRNTLAALIGIYAEEPYKNYEEAQKYAQQLVADNPNDSKNLYALANL